MSAYPTNQPELALVRVDPAGAPEAERVTAGEDEQMLVITDEARDKVIGFRSAQADPESQAMWLEITGVSADEYTYTMSLKPLSAAGMKDAVLQFEDLTVVVPEADFEKVRGATIEWFDAFSGGGLRLRNPNSPSPAVGTRPPADLSGAVPQRVMQVLEQQVNPAIAAHGGSAELVAVEEGTAYLRLGGGCQGCGMATVTLNQGIEVAIRDAVPQITQVVDVTDHASGTNPYFEPSKK